MLINAVVVDIQKHGILKAKLRTRAWGDQACDFTGEWAGGEGDVLKQDLAFDDRRSRLSARGIDREGSTVDDGGEPAPDSCSVVEHGYDVGQNAV